MKKQFAVFGLGNFGESVAISLEKLGCDVVVVDASAEKIQDISDEVSYAMRGDITDPDVLQSLGARNLDGAIIAVAENMEASIMATIISKEIGIPFVIAKAKNERHAMILEKIGADKVVFPEREMGSRVAKNLMVSSFEDLIEVSPDYSLVRLTVPDEWVGKSLIELKLREKYKVNVVGTIQNGEVHAEINPQEPLQEKTRIMMIGSNKNLEKFKS
ncbi:MAG: TrkA family potassium uptake protein [Hespellia sp.]|nr:TrkA family potassium uptake protein [Hespellia sp.]